MKKLIFISAGLLVGMVAIVMLFTSPGVLRMAKAAVGGVVTISARITGVSLPLNASDVATKAYVDAAGGGSFAFAGYTAQAYDGNLGGLKGANDKCESNFPGSHWASIDELSRLGASYTWVATVWVRGVNLALMDDINSPYGFGFMFTDGNPFTSYLMNYCDAWSSVWGFIGGPISIAGSGVVRVDRCTMAHQLACVK